MLSVKPEDKTMSKPGINLRNSSTYHTLLASSIGKCSLVRSLGKRLHLPMGWYNIPTRLLSTAHHQLLKDLSVLSVQRTGEIDNKPG